jgi:hypothetical protein
VKIKKRSFDIETLALSSGKTLYFVIVFLLLFKIYFLVGLPGFILQGLPMTISLGFNVQ